MNIQEQEMLDKLFNEVPTLSIKDLPIGFSGTLLYGYTLERKTFHVYVKDGKISVLKYFPSQEGVEDDNSDFISNESLPMNLFIASKRAYPESTAFFFAKLLQEKGYRIPFTTFNPAGKQLVVGKFLESVRVV